MKNKVTIAVEPLSITGTQAREMLGGKAQHLQKLIDDGYITRLTDGNKNVTFDLADFRRGYAAAKANNDLPGQVETN